MCVLIHAPQLLKKKNEVLTQERKVYTQGFGSPWVTAFLMVLHADLPANRGCGVVCLTCGPRRIDDTVQSPSLERRGHQREILCMRAEQSVCTVVSTEKQQGCVSLVLGRALRRPSKQCLCGVLGNRWPGLTSASTTVSLL